jgi:methionine synthase II (cobalamin-independent)
MILPELVVDRIIAFAEIVGRENVMAGTDCGLSRRCSDVGSSVSSNSRLSGMSYFQRPSIQKVS